MGKKLRFFSIFVVLVAATSVLPATTIGFCGPAGDDPAIDIELFDGAADGATFGSTVGIPNIGAMSGMRVGSPASFACKEVDGFSAAGIVGGMAGGEIDPGESVTFDFNPPLNVFGNAVEVAGMRLVFLFNGPEYGDPQEIGQITASFAAGGTGVYRFQVTAENVLSWTTFSGPVFTPPAISNCSPTAVGFGGCFDFGTLFGGTPATALSFTAVGNRVNAVNNNSDFSISRLTVLPTPPVINEVPEPSTYVLLSLGLLSLAVIRRRSRSQASRS